MSRPVPYLTAVATGVISAAWTSGAIAGLSIIGCPAALDFPHHLSAGVWRGLYEHGFAAMPKFAATTAAVYLETNRALLLAAGDTSPQQATERIVELIGTWKALNLGRSLLALAGAVVGALSFFNTP
ncbi:Indoleacetamide hydrolase [Verticillium dahliae VDG1]|nr:Indoleacetamide hydrolase [Verticillium dahliae VDG1]